MNSGQKMNGHILREVSFSSESRQYNTGSTVDTESAAEQADVNVAATTNFAEGDKVIINRGGDTEEEGVIDSISAGVSITLTANLVSTHAATETVEIIVICKTDALIKRNYDSMVIFMPSAWETADITLLASSEKEGTYNKVCYAGDGSEVTINAAANSVIALNGEIMEAIKCLPYIKFRSGTSDTEVDQSAADKTLKIALMR